MNKPEHDVRRQQLDRELRALPVWNPPVGFAAGVVARALRERRHRLAAPPSYDLSAANLLLWSLAVLGAAAFATWSVVALPAPLLTNLWTLIAVCVGLALTLRQLVDRWYAPLART